LSARCTDHCLANIDTDHLSFWGDQPRQCDRVFPGPTTQLQDDVAAGKMQPVNDDRFGCADGG
jgi:hypothetical protein